MPGKSSKQEQNVWKLCHASFSRYIFLAEEKEHTNKKENDFTYKSSLAIAASSYVFLICGALVK